MASKLTEQERRLISYVFFHGGESSAAIARALKSNESTVRRMIQRLHKRGIIYPVPFVNAASIGLTTYQIFISVLNSGAQTFQLLESYLRKNECVAWVGGLGAEYHFDVILLADNLSDVATFLNEIAAAIPKLEFRASVAGQVRFTYYLPRYLSHERFDRDFLTLPGWQEALNLSEQDHTILRALIELPDLSQTQIAKKVGAPPSTIQYRIQHMQKKGIIQGFGYMVRPFAVGVTPFIYLVHAKRRSTTLHTQLHKFALAHKSVTFLIEQVGDWDYQIGARFQDPHESVQFVATLNDTFGSVFARIRPIPVLESTKFEAYPRRRLRKSGPS